MFPMDAQNAQAEAPAAKAAPLGTRPAPPDLNFSDVANSLATARSPLVIAGSGVFYGESGHSMLRFCETCRVPVVTPIWDRGSVDRTSPVFLGVVGAASGGPVALSEADVILMAGAEIDYRVGYLLPPDVREDARLFMFERSWDTLTQACRNQDISAREAWLTGCIRRRDEFRVRAVKRAT